MRYKILMKNKEIHMSSPQYNIWQNENNADELYFLIQKNYGNIDIIGSSVTMHYILHPASSAESDPVTNNGNITLLTLLPSEKQVDYLETTVPITITHTKKIGMMELWIEINNPEGKVVLKTNTLLLAIKEHKVITDYIEQEQIDILSDYIIKMQQLVNTCNITLEKVSEQATIASNAAKVAYDIAKDLEDRYGI